MFYLLGMRRVRNEHVCVHVRPVRNPLCFVKTLHHMRPILTRLENFKFEIFRSSTITPEVRQLLFDSEDLVVRRFKFEIF